MAKQKGKTNSAVEILHKRYVKDDPKRQASLEQERVNAQVAQMIYDSRKQLGLSQGELADLVGTTQSAISRLEQADYAGHSLTMLRRIADALEQKLVVEMVAGSPEVSKLKYAFRLLVRLLRRQRGLSVTALAGNIDLDADEIRAMESDSCYRPSPLVLHKLSEFYGIPERRMLELAGAVKEVPDEFQENASRFAAHSESFAELSEEERGALDKFMSFLKSNE